MVQIYHYSFLPAVILGHVNRHICVKYIQHVALTFSKAHSRQNTVFSAQHEHFTQLTTQSNAEVKDSNQKPDTNTAVWDYTTAVEFYIV